MYKKQRSDYDVYDYMINDWNETENKNRSQRSDINWPRTRHGH